MSLFAELKRRNVFRVGAAYLVVAWLLVEVSDTIFPRLGLPEWTVTFVIALLLLGLPLALFLAWAFELTPEGVKRTEDVQLDESVTPQTGRNIDKLILVGMVVVVAVIVADRVVFKEGGRGEPVLPTEQAGRSPAEEAGDAVMPAEEAPATIISSAATDEARLANASGIAVLPFVNMSPDPENAYFADGISEELLNILAGIEGLKVASRTSAFSFKGRDTPIPEIARQLGVRHVLEGSVRKQGQRVRITAQLVEAGADAHLWSQTYERDLVDVFRVQEEIARAITTALADILGARRVSVEAPTRDLVAYERFLRGRTLFYQRLDLDDAIDDMQFVVDRDPNFAEAWAFLGAATGVVRAGGYATRFDRAELDSRSQAAVRRALELDPNLPLALATLGLGLVASKSPEQIAEGLQYLQRAAAGIHPDSSPRLWYGISLAELGYIERALPVLESARGAVRRLPIDCSMRSRVPRGAAPTSCAFPPGCPDSSGCAKIRASSNSCARTVRWVTGRRTASRPAAWPSTATRAAGSTARSGDREPVRRTETPQRVRDGAAYLVVGWLIEVADTVFPRLGLLECGIEARYRIATKMVPVSFPA